jgi:hypothetical protein
MEIEDINAKYDSFARTEKAIEDEKLKIARKSRILHEESIEFIMKIKSEGWRFTSKGWEKLE